MRDTKMMHQTRSLREFYILIVVSNFVTGSFNLKVVGGTRQPLPLSSDTFHTRKMSLVSVIFKSPSGTRRHTYINPTS